VTETIVVVGPAATGKSTLGTVVAARLGKPFVDIDEIAWPYYAETGWDLERLHDRIRAVGRVAAEREWEPARAYAVEHVLADHAGTLIALGAGHTSYTDPSCTQRVHAALSQVPSVVLLLPSPDPQRSVAVLRERSITSKGTDWIRDGHDFLAEWVAEPLNHAVATSVVFTDGLTPEQTAERIIAEVPESSRTESGT
jgi:shikimate kinase